MKAQGLVGSGCVGKDSKFGGGSKPLVGFSDQRQESPSLATTKVPLSGQDELSNQLIL